MTDIKNNEKEAFGLYLANLLKSKKIGQQPLANHLNVSVGMVSKFVTGRNLPSDARMEAIIDFLNFHISQDEEMRLMQLYMNAASPIASMIESKSRNVLENHFLSLFHQMTEAQQYKMLSDMLQVVEDNKNQMAKNANLD